MPAQTITPDEAAELYEAENGDEVGRFLRIDDIRTATGRWLQHRSMILLHDQTGYWALPYALGLTEEQADELPWKDRSGPIDLERVHGRPTTVIEWAPGPDPNPDPSNPLRDPTLRDELTSKPSGPGGPATENHADPALRDELIDILSPHSTNCQDTDCAWCDTATEQADLVLTAVADRLDTQGHYHAAHDIRTNAI